MTENLNGHLIRKSFHQIPKWSGELIEDNYGGKAVLDYHGEPVFAELYALRHFWESSYKGFWADTFRRRYRAQLPEHNEPKPMLPEFVQTMLSLISPSGKMTGTWDLLLWKGKQIYFVELKRKSKDKIRSTQIEFLERALAAGVPLENFEIFEWDVLE